MLTALLILVAILACAALCYVSFKAWSALFNGDVCGWLVWRGIGELAGQALSAVLSAVLDQK